MKNKDDYAQETDVAKISDSSITLIDEVVNNQHVLTYDPQRHSLNINKVIDPKYTTGIMVTNINDGIEASEEDKKRLGISVNLSLFYYTPSDWRAELYMQGLEAIKEKKRPDVYQQELLDLFDSIYEWGYYDDTNTWIPNGRFKSETVYKPNSLNYWMDFLEPIDKFCGMSVDEIEPKLYSYQQDKIVKIYTDEVPNCIIIDREMDDDYQAELRKRCDEAGQPRSVVEGNLYNLLAEQTIGYSAQEVARNLLYQYTTYNEVISLQCIPIYYLDVNTRITVEDKQSGIFGDYIINSINIPLSPTSTMNISASRALNRI